MKSIKWLVLSLSVLVFAGCANVERQAYNREAATHIKKVAVTKRTGAESYDIVIVAHPGVNFGLIGGLVAAADMSSKSTRLTTALNPEQTALQDRVATRLVDALILGGYESEALSLDKGVDTKSAFSTLRPQLKCDALLALEISGSYIAAGPSSDYVPFVRVKVLQTDATSGQVLYQDTVTYGYTHQHLKTVHLPADGKYRFKDMDALVAAPDLAREGLYAGVDAIVAQISSDLKR